MGVQRGAFHLYMAGTFRLTGPDGVRIDVSSKRGQAMLAMLATAPNGERTRAWLQEHLWGQRAPAQASASLRRELSNLRKLIPQAEATPPLLDANFQRVWMNLDLLSVDVRDGRGGGDAHGRSSFLEGLDIAGEDGFEDWLRTERAAFERQTPPPQLSPSLTPQIVPPLTSAANPQASHHSVAEFADRPAIAVLPFYVMGGGEDDAMVTAMAQGLSEDLLDRLARLRWLPVIAHASSYYAATQGMAAGTGHDLGARYIVNGHLRPKGGSGGDASWLLSATLTDTANGQLLWSARLDVSDVGAQDDMLSSIAANLGLKIDQYEQKRAIGPARESREFADLIWRGRWHMARLNHTDAEAAQACFDAALALKPQSAEALIQSAWVMLYDLWITRGAEADIRDVRAMAQRAIIADYDDARGHMLAGIAEIWLRQPLRAEALLRRAIALNPSLVMAHSQLGTALNLAGQHEDALDHLRLAMRLSPNDPELFFTLAEVAAAHVMLGDYAEALRFAEESLLRRGAYWFAHLVKINALARMADEPRADEPRADKPRVAAMVAAARADLAAARPDFADSHIDWLPYLDPAKHDFLKAGLNPMPV